MNGNDICYRYATMIGGFAVMNPANKPGPATFPQQGRL
jgi:hypothetical protein